MTKRVLVTTALEETWPQDKPILFLGEWCRRYTRKVVWETLDAEVLPYHWDNRVKLYQDYSYLQEFYERLLVSLAQQLNNIHCTDYSLRYWRILIGPWLGYFVQILFDRWSSIQQAISVFEISETIVLTAQEKHFIPNDMVGFTTFFVGDEWNHYIYASILRRLSSVKLINKSGGGSVVAVRSNLPINSKKPGIKQRIIKWSSGLLKFLSKDKDIFFYKTYLPFFSELAIQCRFGQIPQIWQRFSSELVEPDQAKRQWTLPGDYQSDFEVFVREMIPLQIPAVYLEGYADLLTSIVNSSWPKHPKLIWTSNAHIDDDIFKAWAAQKVDQGVPLVLGQHGGLYGIGKWSFVESHELAICDRYISWGWRELSQDKVIPVGMIKAKKPLHVEHASKSKLLLVTLVPPRYSFCPASCVFSRQWLDYFNDQCLFVEKLSRSIQNSVTVRMYSHDYGWDHKARWQDQFSHLYLDEGNSSIEHLLSDTRLYVSTYNSTTYLEAFSMDIPTVIFWNIEHNELRDSAIPYFEDLKRVGIFHETPESAAEHVGRVWDNVAEWWYSEPVREVLTRFKKNYCHLPKDLLGHLKVALCTVFSEEQSSIDAE